MATTEIYTLSLHDALPICIARPRRPWCRRRSWPGSWHRPRSRSEEHTSELQSLTNLVCRLLLEKKNRKEKNDYDESQSRRFFQRQIRPITINSTDIPEIIL